MNPKQIAIMNEGLFLVKTHRDTEYNLILNIQKVEASDTHKALGKRLIIYLVDVYGFSRAHAYGLKAVAQRCLKIPKLAEALEMRKLTVYCASRLMPILTLENAEEVLQFAVTHSTEEVEEDVANRNPKREIPTKFKKLSADRVAMKGTISTEIYESLQRAMAILAQKHSRDVKFEECLGTILSEYLERHDPVRKAKRAKPQTVQDLENPTHGRQPLTAEQKHAVNLRDRGKCTHVDSQGKRCNQDRWTQIHHLKHVQYGGTNHPDNLTTLCSFHHDVVHQLVFTMEQGESNGLRSPQTPYSANDWH